jgi:hypothetical protein
MVLPIQMDVIRAEASARRITSTSISRLPRAPRGNGHCIEAQQSNPYNRDADKGNQIP